MVSRYVANTDNEWFDFLASESDVAEVNFWQPDAKPFIACASGRSSNHGVIGVSWMPRLRGA
jgi:hypothetical protein